MELGMVGLGVMGRNLALNMAEKGFSVAGYDTDPAKVEALDREAEARPAAGVATVEELARRLRAPRAVMMLVPAGPPVDAVIEALLPHLQPGDLLIDGGNSHFRETDARARRLEASQVLYMGVGISGGERGARLGPSIMPGGPAAAYERVRPIFEAVAAKVDGEPCVAHLGPGSAGDYVKMVHNGIEYAVMELIAESYHLMKQGLGLSNDAPPGGLRRLEQLRSCRAISSRSRPGSSRRRTRSRAAFSWTRSSTRPGRRARANGPPRTPWSCACLCRPSTAAVAMRDLSDLRDERRQAASLLAGPPGRTEEEDGAASSRRLGRAMRASMVIVFAQGMAQLERGVAGLRVRVEAGGGGAGLEGRLHHPLGSARPHPPGLPRQARSAEPPPRSQSSARWRPTTRRTCGPWSATQPASAYRRPRWRPASPISTPTGARGCPRTSSRPRGTISAPTSIGGSTGRVSFHTEWE